MAAALDHLRQGRLDRAVTPNRSTSMTRWKVSVGIARKVATREAMPALATTTSRPPKRSTVSATARWRAPRSVTSAARPIARESCSWEAARAVASASRSAIATEAPRDDQGAGGGEADAAGAAGDEGDLAGQ